MLASGHQASRDLFHNVNQRSAMALYSLRPPTSRNALLEYLIRHSGRVVTRAEIAAHLWAATGAVSMAMVDGVINDLRKFIDRGSPLIGTCGNRANHPRVTDNRRSRNPDEDREAHR